MSVGTYNLSKLQYFKLYMITTSKQHCRRVYYCDDVPIVPKYNNNTYLPILYDITLIIIIMAVNRAVTSSAHSTRELALCALNPPMGTRRFLVLFCHRAVLNKKIYPPLASSGFYMGPLVMMNDLYTH